MSAVTIDNDLVHYEVLGRGRPVILLHGWLNSWRYWLPSMQQLSMKYRTYAVDLWGYGDSGKDPQKLGLDAQIELLNTFMDRLGIPKAAFVGHSLGAAVMIRYALRSPARVARLMVISPPVFESEQASAPVPDTPPPSPPVPAPPTVMARPAELQKRIAEGQAAPPASASDATVLRRPGMAPLAGTEIKPGDPIPRLSDLGLPGAPAAKETPVTPGPLRKVLADKTPQDLLAEHLDRDTPEYERYVAEVAKTAPTAFASSMQSFDRIDLAHDIRRLATPTLMIHGENDRFLKAPSAELMTFLGYNNSSFRCEVVPEVGHFPMLSDPANFHRLIMDFLEVQSLSDIVLYKDRWVRKVR